MRPGPESTSELSGPAYIAPNPENNVPRGDQAAMLAKNACGDERNAVRPRESDGWRSMSYLNLQTRDTRGRCNQSGSSQGNPCGPPGAPRNPQGSICPKYTFRTIVGGRFRLKIRYSRDCHHNIAGAGIWPTVQNPQQVAEVCSALTLKKTAATANRTVGGLSVSPDRYAYWNGRSS